MSIILIHVQFRCGIEINVPSHSLQDLLPFVPDEYKLQVSTPTKYVSCHSCVDPWKPRRFVTSQHLCCVLLLFF